MGTNTRTATGTHSDTAAITSQSEDPLAVQQLSDPLSDPLHDPLEAAASPAVQSAVQLADDGAADPGGEQPQGAASSPPQEGTEAGTDTQEQAAGQEWFDKLLGLYRKLGRYREYARDQRTHHMTAARAGGASSDASERYEASYDQMFHDVESARTYCAQKLIHLGDGSGHPRPDVHPDFVRQEYSEILSRVVSIEADMEMSPTRYRNRMDRENAEDAIAAAQQARKILKKSSVTVLQYGLRTLGCDAETAGRISKLYGTFLDTLDVAVGDRWILQGQPTSPEQMQAIYAAQLMKLAVDEAHDKFIGQFLEHDVTKTLANSLGAAAVGDIIKTTIDLAFVKWGPTLAPSSESIAKAWSQALAAKQQDMQDMVSLDFSNQGFVNWLTDTSCDVMGLAVDAAAKKKFGG